MLRLVLDPAGYVVIGAYTHELRDGPRLIIYDVAPPYDRNWRLMQHFTTMPALQGINFLITTTNRKVVLELAGPDQDIFEIVGKPYDLGLSVQAVKNAVPASSV